MDNAPAEAPAPAPTGESVATPNTNVETTAAPQTPDMHGFTSEQLADMKRFFDNNGGFDGVKAKISNPQPAPAPEAQTKESNPTSQPQSQPQQPEQAYVPPKGAVTQDELMAQYYFEMLSKRPEYASISNEISGGTVLTEMAKLGIPFRNPDGSWNNDKINDYLDLRAKTVPAKPTATEPNASAAPTVTYTEVGDNIADINQAYKVIMEPGNPAMKKAEEFIKNSLNKK